MEVKATADPNHGATTDRWSPGRSGATIASKLGTTDNRHLDRLMQAAQAGDSRAYAELLREIVPRLRRIIARKRRFLSASEIEDLVQDVLLSLHAVRATYDPRRPFIPWLMGIMRNRLADRARQQMRTKEHEIQVERLPVTFLDDQANERLEAYGDRDALRQAIRELPPGQRSAIEMLKLREMSLKEAAAVSGTSIAALKVSVHRAMLSLRKTLKKD